MALLGMKKKKSSKMSLKSQEYYSKTLKVGNFTLLFLKNGINSNLMISLEKKHKSQSMDYSNDSSRIKFNKGRMEESRQSSDDSYNILSGSSEMIKRKVNFRHKGSVNFSYSFLPGDVMSRKYRHFIAMKMKTLDDLMGKHNQSNSDIKDQFIKQTVAAHIKIPKIQNNSMAVLVQILKDDTDKKVSEIKSDAVVFPAYRSHKLLQNMEEKELKFKKLQRMKELSMKQKSFNRKKSQTPYDFNPISPDKFDVSQISFNNGRMSSTLDHSEINYPNK
jgi:hypothetical protein